MARNEGLSTDVLVGLAGDAAPQVAAGVAANRRTPLRRIAELNPNAREKVLEALRRRESDRGAGERN